MWNAYLDSNSVSFMSNPTVNIATIASNGAYLFLHDSCGLVKIGTGFYSDAVSTTRGKVFTRNADWKINEKGWLVCVQDKLYYRSPNIEPATLVVFNAKTLKVTTNNFTISCMTNYSNDNSYNCSSLSLS